MDYAAFKSSPIITRPLPNGVTYDLSERHQTTITLPVGSAWSSELHWHETHTEYLQVVRGSVLVRLDARTFVVSAPRPGEPKAVVKVERGVRHEWHRADRGAGQEGDGEEVVVIESTDPADGGKTVFFWNVNGAILDSQAGYQGLWLEFWITLRLFVIFAALDNCPALVDGNQKPWSVIPVLLRRAIEWTLTHAAMAFAVLLGRVLQMEAVDERYTPEGLRLEWGKTTKESKKVG